MSPRSLARLLASTRALPPRAALFQARAMLRAARLGDDWALVSSTRPRDVAELLRLARGRRSVVELGTATGWTAGAFLLADPQRRLASYDPVVREHRDAYLALLPRAARERLELVQAPGHEPIGAPGREPIGAPGRRGGVELLFVDSSHDRDATIAEFRAWQPLLAPGALVVLHDHGNPA
ncbi:MAG: Methyltransferase domain, partial [Solirubrobacteraceae bacterium]|nr:Methyltransferase domain [Solirubrobacteraceae bacterium]